MDGQYSSLFRGFHRGLSLFVGLMTALNLTGELLTKNFNANLWWIDLTPIPPAIGNAFLGALAILLLIQGLSTRWMVKPLRGLCIVMLLIMIFATIGNGWVYIRLLKEGALHGGYPVPFSWMVTLAMGILLWGFLKNQTPPTEEPKSKTLAGLFGFVLALAICFAGVPLGQMACFGNTDYARKADVAVVFGAKANSDGSCSQALADRVKKACDLYKEGLVTKLILSGGPGEGATSEPKAMKNLAMKLGVPENRIILDENGLNSAKTVEFAADYLTKHPNEKMIAISHFYHLPRIKMAFERKGHDPYTSPCAQDPVMSGLPRMMAREVPAIWWYYIMPLAKE